MEVALVEKTIYLPPFLVAALMVLHHSTVFCLTCNSFLSSLWVEAHSKALVLQTASKELMLTGIHSTALMIITRIQGTLVLFQQTGRFLQSIIASILYKIDSVKNETLAIVTYYLGSTPKSPYETAYTVALSVGFFGILVFTFHYLSENRSVKMKEEPVSVSASGSVSNEKKGPVRRKGRKASA